MKKELLVIGAGNIGRGVIGGLFFESGYHLYIYDIMEERMKQLKEQCPHQTELLAEKYKRSLIHVDPDILVCSHSVDMIRHMKNVASIAC